MVGILCTFFASYPFLNFFVCRSPPGAVIHRSNHNHSNKSRMIYTFHIIDGAATYECVRSSDGSPYLIADFSFVSCDDSEKNWLQPTPSMPFSRLLPTDDEKKTL